MLYSRSSLTIVLLAITFSWLVSCGGPPVSSLLNVVEEEPGENCPDGGLRIEYGRDANRDGHLQAAEITETFYVCHGRTGQAGSDGKDGADGSDGTKGADGFNSLIKITQEFPGKNCATGGLRIDYGLDSDRDGKLDDDEIEGTRYVCNGIDGTDGVDGLQALVQITDESPGENCATGGLRIDTGWDIDRNGLLEGDEIASTHYVCNGEAGDDGADGFNSLVRTHHEPSGPNCAVCGTRYQYGLDINRNGILDDDEVVGTVYLCETRDPGFSLHIETLIQGGGGANEVQRVSILPQGAAVCGSYRLRFGGEDTHSIPYDATAAEVQAALQLLPGIDMVTVTGNPSGPYTIEFGGALSDVNVPQLQAHAVNLR